MLLNAEGLPIEGIDKITVTLNPSISFFIRTEKPYTDYKHDIRLDQVFYFGNWPFLTIQGQKIDPTIDIRFSIAKAIYELIEQKILVFPMPLTFELIYMKLNYFVYNIKEVELYFDFRPNNIRVLYPELLNQIETSLYSNDFRSYPNRPKRKSFLEIYDHAENLKRQRHIAWKRIDENPYKLRIEFNLTKYNSRNLTLDDLSGNYNEVISRYTSYLAVLYSRYFYGNVIVNDIEHSHFNKIYHLAANGKKRYTGNELQKVTKQKKNPEVEKFWNTMFLLNCVNSSNENNDTTKLVEKALKK
ncbi:hypothetical protein AGMMS49546_28240 [Spirochaetia bacterium]|nr:hypothetical protein AGMMS49546_28240 [Spirochaetia bacterium]